MILFVVAILITIAISTYLLLFHRKQTVWWEILVLFGISLGVTGVAKVMVDKVGTRDTEYWGNLGQQTRYYEDWDEEVPCSHTKFCTDSKGNSYACGTQHMYDVDYHPQYWTIYYAYGKEIRIAKTKYKQLVSRWTNNDTATFKDLRRDYHSDDGDMYYAVWDGKEVTAEPITTVHHYENRIQASTDVFNFPEVSDEDREFYGLYEYPGVDGYTCRAVLGWHDAAAEKRFNYINGKYGPPRGSDTTTCLRVWVLVYPAGKQLSTAKVQENYWKGGNKNEFIYCVGVTKKEIRWVHIISWTENQELKLRAKNFVFNMGELDLLKLADYTEKEVTKTWKRKEFEEFSYINVSPPLGLTLMALGVIVIINILAGWWIITNDATEQRKHRGFRRRFHG